ncbi:hypothetical protein ACWD0J_37335 [Streptomyces sp. NPDC003011]
MASSTAGTTTIRQGKGRTRWRRCAAGADDRAIEPKGTRAVQARSAVARDPRGTA